MSHESRSQYLPALDALRIAERSRVTYYACFAHALGNEVGAAMFASCFLFWEGRQEDPEGWIYKTQPEITKETGMKRSMQETARTVLKDAGVLEEVKRGVPGKLFYRFNWDKLNEIITDHFLQIQQDEKGKKKKERQENQQPPLIHAMAAEFENCYFDSAEIEFNWGTSKDNKGKQFGCLKGLHDLIATGIASNKAKAAAQQNGGIVPADAQFQASFDEIIESWKLFLDNLPDFYRTKMLSPDLLLSKYQAIYNEIKTTRKNGNPAKTRTSAAATVR